MQDVLRRIDKRLAGLGISAEAASRLAGDASIISNMRFAARQGRQRAPSVITFARLARILGSPVEWLLFGTGPEEAMPDEETSKMVAAAKSKGRRRKGAISLTAQNIEGPVVLANQGNDGGGVGDNTIGAAGLNSSGLTADAKAELFGLVLEAVAEVYKSKKIRASQADVGKVAYMQYADVAEIPRNKTEYDAIVGLVKVRVVEELKKGSGDSHDSEESE